LIVDAKNFQVLGLLYVSLSDRFLQLLDDQDILSNQNLILTDYYADALFYGQYLPDDPAIRSLIQQTSAPHEIKYVNQRTLVASKVTAQKGWHVYCLIQASALYQKDRIVILYNLLIAAGILGLSVLLTVIIARTITRNITLMDNAMTRVEGGDFMARMKPASYDEIGKLGLRSITWSLRWSR